MKDEMEMTLPPPCPKQLKITDLKWLHTSDATSGEVMSPLNATIATHLPRTTGVATEPYADLSAASGHAVGPRLRPAGYCRSHDYGDIAREEVAINEYGESVRAEAGSSSTTQVWSPYASRATVSF